MVDQTKFVAGGDVQASDGIYIKRPADDELFDLCMAGTFAYVLTSRQLGKSSLKNEVARRLINEGIRVARIDLNRIGQSTEEIEDWYFNLADQIASSLEISQKLEEWWESKSKRLTMINKFLKFLEEIVLVAIKSPIVIFVDEIDMTLGLSFRDDFFASIRTIHNDRSQKSSYKRLTFVLLGVATPDELISDHTRTPFNVGKSIILRDFTFEECRPFCQAVEEKYPGQGENCFLQIYQWTNGHPYLTQKLCLAVVSTKGSYNPILVDNLVKSIFFTEKERPEDNIRFVQTRILGDNLAPELLSEYQQILRGRYISDDEKSIALNRLKLYGLVVAKDGKLATRNRIYGSIFDTVWAENALASLSDKSTTKTAISTPYFLENYFVDGGTLSSRTPSYVIRKADDELLSGILTGELCYVLTSRQMGKSSLMIRIASRLRELGYLAALIDIQVIGTTTEQEWYRSFLSQLRRRLRLKADIEEWWEQQQTLSSPQKLFNFFSDVILGEISENVVIFVDEIDSALRLPFRDDFFAFIRAFYNSRATNREARRLSFVLLGVASPADLIADQARTPFNIGREIKLTDFSFEEAVVLRSAIESIYPGKGEIIYKRIFYWTDGHPYLTQKLCKLAAENQNTSWDTHAIDELVKQLFLIDIYDTNLSFIRDIIIRNPEKRKMLSLYRSIYQGKKVIVDRSSLIQNQLLLSGIVKEKNGFLEVRNNIYRQRFNLAWIRENSPFNLFDRIFGV